MCINDIKLPDIIYLSGSSEPTNLIAKRVQNKFSSFKSTRYEFSELGQVRENYEYLAPIQEAQELDSMEHNDDLSHNCLNESYNYHMTIINSKSVLYELFAH